MPEDDSTAETLGSLSDAEINRRVAEAMGMPLWLGPQGFWTSDSPDMAAAIREHNERFPKTRHEIAAWGAVVNAEVSALPDFLHDWKAFGRFFEWLWESDWIPHIIGSKPVGYGSVGDGYGRAANVHIKYAEPRRALALAFLQAVSE